MGVDVDQALQQLVIGNRILAREGVLDGFGHLSVRHPDNPERYFMACSRGPELVRREDLIEFTLQGEPLNQNGRAMYAERAIHGAIYAARPDVNAVCHNHSPSTIPFGISGTALKPVMHMAALIGADVPVWDIRDDFGDTNLLVREWAQGQSLARTLGDRRVAPAIEAAERNGGNWRAAVAESGVDADFYIFRDRSHDLLLPWDIIDGGMKAQFFRAEFDKGLREQWTLPPKRAAENRKFLPVL